VHKIFRLYVINVLTESIPDMGKRSFVSAKASRPDLELNQSLFSESQGFYLRGQSDWSVSSSFIAISRVMKSSSYTCSSPYIFMACLLRAALTLRPLLVGPCHHARALPEVADGVMASSRVGSCEYLEQAVEGSRQVYSFSLGVGRGANNSSPQTKCHVMKHFTRPELG
jgi:hypothetical protein